MRAMVLGAIAFTGLTAAFPALKVDVYKGATRAGARGVDDPAREMRLAHLDWFQPSVVFYAHREVTDLKSVEQAAEFLAVPTPGFLFVPAKTWEQFVEPKVAVPTRIVARHYDFTGTARSSLLPMK
ncbi:hypothetical protein J8F10_22525 [Gemmata sp. G18]|uniref:Uncharacterized protein n=1 Tax=Gemmata palustris TaxID=2822762 RepID=A0ABS5BWC5_9BACT|nr:hypothetical protein [Gemmata palustris]MBP3958041.1 hypothetical protein [Gemmata palustris]